MDIEEGNATERKERSEKRSDIGRIRLEVIINSTLLALALHALPFSCQIAYSIGFCAGFKKDIKSRYLILDNKTRKCECCNSSVSSNLVY